ncbi:hypothetical protein HMPREF9499_00635 [Enterococcus faecalis TX0012]|nr:hypothetical protein HMPREF9499_00635 [Enterococcus faecalis TX0012]
MTINLVLLIAFQLTGQIVHELLGLAMLFLFLIHQVLNLSWYKRMFKGTYNVRRMVNTLLNVSLLLIIGILIISGICMSHIFSKYLPIEISFSVMRKLHLLLCYWLFLLIGLHIGMHWNVFQRLLNKMNKKCRWNLPMNLRNYFTTKKIGMFIGVIVSIYGIYVFISLKIYLYMFMLSEFMYFDYSKNKFLVILDILSMLTIVVFCGQILDEKLKTTEKRRKTNRRKSFRGRDN